jgi:hypothetical protein
MVRPTVSGWQKAFSDVIVQPSGRPVSRYLSMGLSDPWRHGLPQAHRQQAWRLGGWVALSAVGNSDSPPSQYNGITGFSDRRRPQADQLYLYLEKPANPFARQTELGVRADAFYGSDYPFVEAAGLE